MQKCLSPGCEEAYPYATECTVIGFDLTTIHLINSSYYVQLEPLSKEVDEQMRKWMDKTPAMAVVKGTAKPGTAGSSKSDKKGKKGKKK